LITTVDIYLQLGTLTADVLLYGTETARGWARVDAAGQLLWWANRGQHDSQHSQHVYAISWHQTTFGRSVSSQIAWFNTTRTVRDTVLKCAEVTMWSIRLLHRTKERQNKQSLWNPRKNV